jgi:p24 family protein delta-1
MHSAENVESGKFAFATKEAGDYLACFWTPEHKPAATINFEFEWKSGVTAKDWSNVAKKGQVEVIAASSFPTMCSNRVRIKMSSGPVC